MRYIICVRNFDDWFESKRNSKLGRIIPNWEWKLETHYNFCMTTTMMAQQACNNVFVFEYDRGEEELHQAEINAVVGKELNWSDFVRKAYKKEEA